MASNQSEDIPVETEVASSEKPPAFCGEEFKDLNLKFTQMGVIIINSDGTMSKIPNWKDLTEMEQLRTVRLISKRNQKRKEALLAAEAAGIPIESAAATHASADPWMAPDQGCAKSADESVEVLTIQDGSTSSSSAPAPAPAP